MDQTLLQDLLKLWLMPSAISALFAFLLGLVWYHPKVLGSKWVESRGKTWADLPKSSTFVISFPLWFLTSLFFTFMVIYFHIDTTSEMLLLACMLWVAFAMPPIVMGQLYTGDPFNAVAVDATYQLAGYYVIGLTHVVLGMLQVV